MNKSIFWGVFSGFCAYFVRLFGSVIQSAFVIRYLDPVNAGIWFLFLGIFTFISLCDFGLSPTLSRELGLASYKRNRKYRERLLYSTIRKLNRILSLIVFVVLVITLIVIEFNKSVDLNIIIAFSLFSIAVVIRFLANPALAFIYGYGYVSTQKWLLTIASAINALLGAIALYLGGGLIGISAVYLFSFLLLCLFSSYYVSRHFKIKSNNKIQTVVIKRIFEPCIQWSLMTLGTVLIFQIDAFILAIIVGVVEVTVFAVIKQLCSAIIGLSGIFNGASVPFISSKKGASDHQGVYKLFIFNVKFATMLAIFMAVFILFNHVELGHFWLGEKFSFNVTLLVVMCISTILEVHHVSCGQVTMAAGYVKFAKIALIAGALNLILSIVFAYLYGVVGVGVALLITQLSTNNWYVVKKAIGFLKLSLKQYAMLVLQLILYLIFNILFNVLLVYWMPFMSDFWHLLVSGMMNLVFFCLFILTMADERQVVIKILKYYFVKH
ncbi:oligosaccharide flippase family protein [bacterium SCSIO 12844]|nr:oligosaccharide flippase family protein [bacterium SCSIO 12844]